MRAVRSALEQNGGDVRVIVIIDDGSEETQRILMEVGDSRLTVLVNERNFGAPASRNRGLDHASSPYVSFLDADDFFDGNLIAPLIKKMKAEDAQIGFGPSLQWHPLRGLCNGWSPNYRDHEDVFVQWLSAKQNVNTASVLWSTDYLRGIGGWDEKLKRAQDGEVALRAILLGAVFVMTAEGAGVWSIDPRATRITKRNDNLSSLLDVADKFLAMRSDSVSDQVRIRACAYFLYKAAYLAYSRGCDDLGRTALRRSRELGFNGHLGTVRHIVASRILGLPAKQKATRFAKRWLSGKAEGGSPVEVEC